MRFFPLFLLFSSIVWGQGTPEKSFQMLKEGNQRFVQGKSDHPDRVAERRLETENLQEPFAAIVGCSDSRVGPEIIFDQGIGDLFTVRVAGNVVGPVEQASIEYAVLHLHAPFIMVLGHQNCGAVKAVLAGETEGIQPVADLIQPALNRKSSSSLETAIKANAQFVAALLRKHPDFAPLIQQKKLLIKQGYYNFKTGVVEILPDLNRQVAALLNPSS